MSRGPLAIHPRWFAWAARLMLTACFATLMWWLTVYRWRQDDAESVLIAGFVTLLLLGLMVRTGRFGLCADRAGFALRVDHVGLHHCLLPSIRWREVRRVGFEKMPFDSSGRHGWHLVVTGDGGLVERLRRRTWRQWLPWDEPQFLHGDAVLIPMRLLKCDAHLFFDDVRLFVRTRGIPGILFHSNGGSILP